MTDQQLIKRRSKANKIMAAPYRKSINYIKIIDIIRECTDKIYNNSLDRVFNRV